MLLTFDLYYNRIKRSCGEILQVKSKRSSCEFLERNSVRLFGYKKIGGRNIVFHQSMVFCKKEYITRIEECGGKHKR